MYYLQNKTYIDSICLRKVPPPQCLPAEGELVTLHSLMNHHKLPVIILSLYLMLFEFKRQVLKFYKRQSFLQVERQLKAYAPHISALLRVARTAKFVHQSV